MEKTILSPRAKLNNAGQFLRVENGKIVLLPLCNHGMRRREVVRRATDAITSQVSDSVVQGDLLGTTAIFANLVLKHTRFYEQVLAEGRLEAHRADIFEVVVARFGADVAREFKERIEQVDDEDQLLALVRLAATCRSAAQYRRELASLTPTAN